MKKNLCPFLCLLSLGLISIQGLYRQYNFTKQSLFLADDIVSNPKISLNSSYDSYIENSFYSISGRIENPSDLNSLQLEISYDSNYLEIASVSNYIDDSLFDYKIKDDSISLTYIFTTPIDETIDLFSLSFNTLKIGNTSLDVFVLDANNSTESVNIDGSSFPLNIQKSNQKKYCEFISSISKSSNLKKNEEFSITYTSYYLNEIAAGEFTFHYDNENLQFLSLDKEAFLEEENIIFDYRCKEEESINLSFVASKNVNQYSFVTLNFKVKNNIDSSSNTITMESTSLCDFQMNDYQKISITDCVSTIYDSALEKNPEMSLQGQKEKDQLILTVNLAEKSNLAAGNFKINFPTDYFSFDTCKDIKNKNTIDYLLINATKADQGEIDFYIINPNQNIITEESILLINLSPKQKCEDYMAQISIFGNELCNIDNQEILLDFIPYNVTYKGIGHSYGEWTAEREAECTEAGEESRTCQACGEKETREIPARGHAFQEGWTTDREPTCTEKGSKSHRCAYCGARSDVTEIPALGHSAADPVMEDFSGPLCDAEGSYDEVVYCSLCHEELSRRKVAVPATGHSFGEWETDREPTCTEKGSRHRTCPSCGTREEEEIPARGHETEALPGKEPSCTEAGWKEYEVCTRCGHSTYEEIPALGHSYGEWTAEREASTSEEGILKRTCKICGNEEIKTIPKLTKDKTPIILVSIIGGCFVLTLGGLIFFFFKKKKKRK